jgi:hypothetical protein
MCDEQMFQRFTYIFSAVGLTDLKVGVSDFGSSNCKVYFVQERSHYPSPRNGFFCVDDDINRYKENVVTHRTVMNSQPVIDPVPFETIEAFLSLGNSNRAIMEQRGNDPVDFDRVRTIYSNCIRLSRDESARKILDMINMRTECITFCSTDDDETALVPEKIRMVVAEAFAGLAMVAIHQNRCLQAIGFATAALSKHPSALTFVNCARMVSSARKDMRAVMYFTEMVILPFFYRTKDAALHSLYDREMGIWDPVVQKSLSKLPPTLASAAQSMISRFSGQYGVMKARLIGGTFVERSCKVCGKGFEGEKLFRCAGCERVYYCGKGCQQAHWKEHKAGCSAGPADGI